MQIYIPKIPGIPSNYEYSPSDFHLEYEVVLATQPPIATHDPAVSPLPCTLATGKAHQMTLTRPLDVLLHETTERWCTRGCELLRYRMWI